VPPEFNAHVPNTARIWNYWLGGKANFSADRDAAAKIMAELPALPKIALAARRFLIDVVHRLAAEQGISQFLDIGAGLPVSDSTHEVAQRVNAAARVVYVDNDPMVGSHARALLTSSQPDRTAFVDGDLHDADRIIAAAQKTIDFSQPAALLLIEVLHFIPDADDPYAIVRHLLDALAPGSYLVISHGGSDVQAEQVAAMSSRYNQEVATHITLRTRDQVARFFDGLDLMPPGVVPRLEWWQPNPGRQLPGYVGVGRLG
jgi:SAM-dependent methyltransferase